MLKHDQKMSKTGLEYLAIPDQTGRKQASKER